MKKSSVRISILTPIFLALVFVAAGNVFGQSIDPNALYHITAKHSGKCLDVTGGVGAQSNGVQVEQWECNGGENQKWSLTDVGNGYFKIVAKHSGKALDVFGGVVSLGNGVMVEQWQYNGGTNQQWQLSSVGDNYYNLTPRHNSHGCLDINGGPTAIANGAKAQQWSCTGGDNQKFRLTSLSPRPVCQVTDPLTSTFTGTAELTTTNPYARGPFPSSIDLAVTFTNCRAGISITTFPPIMGPIDNQLGHDIYTVTRTQGGSGSFDSSNGRTSIRVTLGLQNTLAIYGNSTIPLTLTAEGNSDMENATTGILTLRGTGTFEGGQLNGYQGTVIVTGSFSPRPR